MTKKPLRRPVIINKRFYWVQDDGRLEPIVIRPRALNYLRQTQSIRRNEDATH